MIALDHDPLLRLLDHDSRVLLITGRAAHLQAGFCAGAGFQLHEDLQAVTAGIGLQGVGPRRESDILVMPIPAAQCLQLRVPAPGSDGRRAR